MNETPNETQGNLMRPQCYDCTFRRAVPGDCHFSCANEEAHVTGNPIGRQRGWFAWPYIFDPVWLMTCDGFQAKEKSNG